MLMYHNIVVLLVIMVPILAIAQPLAPALILFGDSINDVGNNNHLSTIIKANFSPYGRDFNHTATGRFSNGKLAADFTGILNNDIHTKFYINCLNGKIQHIDCKSHTHNQCAGSFHLNSLYKYVKVSETIGFTEYPQPYLSKKAQGEHLLIGANFASASSGYYEATAKLYDTIPLSKQLVYYKEYQKKLVVIAGESNATSIISGAVYLITSGSSDFLQNYYINPFLYKEYTPDQFSDILIKSYADFIQELYGLGARKIGASTLPPLGCLPAAITVFGNDSNECVAKLNKVAVSFNNKLNSTSQYLQTKLSNLTLVVLDIYQPILDLVTHPADNGFAEARKACCGTGLLETSILCNTESPGTCANATEYVFWDGFHPTQAANKILSDDLILEGIALIS